MYDGKFVGANRQVNVAVQSIDGLAFNPCAVPAWTMFATRPHLLPTRALGGVAASFCRQVALHALNQGPVCHCAHAVPSMQVPVPRAFGSRACAARQRPQLPGRDTRSQRTSGTTEHAKTAVPRGTHLWSMRMRSVAAPSATRPRRMSSNSASDSSRGRSRQGLGSRASRLASISSLL
jgi:hypothetical protein